MAGREGCTAHDKGGQWLPLPRCMTSVAAIWLCRRLVLDRTLMEALCGGIGEIAQICVLYPLETIKVRTHPAHAGSF